MLNRKPASCMPLVITLILIGSIYTTRAEPVMVREQQVVPQPTADMKIKLLVEHIEGQLGQDNADFDEVLTMLLTACNLLPAASRTGQQMLSDLPQRLSTRGKEQRAAGSVIKAINYEVFVDSAHCTKNEEKQERSERIDLTASQAPTTKQPTIVDPPKPRSSSQEPVQTNASAGKEADTSPVATTLPHVGKAPPIYQLGQQQPAPEEKPRVTAARAADRSSAARAVPFGPSRSDPSVPERRQPEAFTTRAATAGPQGISKDPSSQVTDQHSPDQPAVTLATQRTLMERGDAMLNQRNVVAARLLFARAADTGVGLAALKLAETYEPQFIADHNLIGIKGNEQEAEAWYRKAAALGETQAEQRLRSLEGRKKTLATQ
jgi:hypothetical protein